MKKIIVFVLALFTVAALVGCSNHTEGSMQLNKDNVKKIVLTYGGNGSQAEITDAETISTITDNFNTLTLKKDGKVNSTGWTYCIGWYDKEGNESAKIYCGAEPKSIVKDGYVWNVTSGSVDVVLLSELLNKR
jgi:uncharacterized protein YcfL